MNFQKPFSKYHNIGIVAESKALEYHLGLKDLSLRVDGSISSMFLSNANSGSTFDYGKVKYNVNTNIMFPGSELRATINSITRSK